MMYGRKPRLPLDLMMPEIGKELQINPESYAESLRKTLQKAYELSKSNRECRMIKEKINYDRKCRSASYKTGDVVLLLDEAKMKGVSNKFRKKWKGPYSVIEFKEGENVVKIKPVNRNGRSLKVN